MTTPGLDVASESLRAELVSLATRYHKAGWMLGTSGNLSARFEGPHGATCVVTASGLDKGALTVDDFVEVTLDGTMVGAGPGRRPSAETSIHTAIYDALPGVTAALHVHSVASTELGRRHGTTAPLHLVDLEMLKGWGMWSPGAEAELPVFDNHSDVPRIAAELSSWLRRPKPRTSPAPAMLIAGHGLTAWGATLSEAHRHVEITEFMCRIGLARLPAEPQPLSTTATS